MHWEKSGAWPAVEKMLEDAFNYDFRPRVASRLIGGAHDGGDIGAYTRNAASYIIPGRMEVAPSSPIPPHGSFRAQPDASLMFLRGSRGEKQNHVVYMSKNVCDVAAMLPCALKQKLDFPDNVYTPTKPLEYDQVYYWRVHAVGGDDMIPSPIFCFRVRAETDTVALSLPWNLATQREPCASLDPQKVCSKSSVGCATPSKSAACKSAKKKSKCSALNGCTWKKKKKMCTSACAPIGRMKACRKMNGCKWVKTSKKCLRKIV